MVSVNEPVLSIIIVSYNTRQLTLQTLHSVFADVEQSEELRHTTEVFVVDNASTDGSVDALAKENCILLSNTKNVGFSAANNQAIKQARGKYILLLNSDTIVQPGALKKMISTFAGHERLGIVTAQLLNQDGSIQRQGGSFPTLLSLAAHMLLLDDIPVLGNFFPSTQKTGHSQGHTHLDWVGGTAMMIRREVLDEVDPLDENIFMYGEDMEFCLRARHHHWDVALEPTAHITHLGSASSSAENALKGEFSAYLYIWAKHMPGWQRPIAKFLLRSGAELRRVLFGTILQQPKKAAVYRSISKTVLQ